MPIYARLVREWPVIQKANLPVHVPEHRRPNWLARVLRRVRG